MKAKEEQTTTTGGQVETVEATEAERPYKIYINNIYSYIDDLIISEYQNKSQEELKQEKSFFPRLVQYLYNNCIGDILQNKLDYKMQGIKPRYEDIKVIDNIFNIYTELVYKYKFNNRPSITEFCLLTGIARDTIYNWLKGDVDNYILNNTSEDKRRYITSEYADTVKKWQMTTEQSLVDGNGVMEIFLLKSVHGFKDTNNDINIHVDSKPLLSADILPALLGQHSKN